MRTSSTEFTPLFQPLNVRLPCVEASPKNASLFAAYANFLSETRNDLGRAEELYCTAVELEPNHASLLGIFAAFLVLSRKDVDRAEVYFRRALDADPKCFPNAFNFAVLLLIQGSIDEGLSRLTAAMESRSEPKDDAYVVAMTFHFYMYGAGKDRKKWLQKLKRLLVSGLRAEGWGFELNIVSAASHGHPQKLWLTPLSKVVSNEADVGILDKWRAWRSLGN